MTQPQVGQPFPEFHLPDAQGQMHDLKQYAGKYVVLYAYPKDDTPGCTKEACDFRDNALLKSHGAVILGISADDAASHSKFAEKFSLPFPLLSDHGATFLKSLGAYGEKQMFGKTFDGIYRQTYLIGPDGKLVNIWPAVSVEGHADEVAAAIAQDQARR